MNSTPLINQKACLDYLMSPPDGGFCFYRAYGVGVEESNGQGIDNAMAGPTPFLIPPS
jgi:hypothetical protein